MRRILWIGIGGFGLMLSCTTPSVALSPALCLVKKKPVVWETFSKKQIPEMSGLQASRTFDSRFYGVSDEKDSFWILEPGEDPQKIKLKNKNTQDIEDVAIGPCGSKTCLFLADIGDNYSNRKSIKIFLVEEKKKYKKSESTLKVITLQYPDHPRDAEAFTVHPKTGDLFILTKAVSVGETGDTGTHLFRVPASQWEKSSSVKLEPYGSLEFRHLGWNGFHRGTRVTAMDIRPDGKTFLVLTREVVYEFAKDLSKDPLPPSSQLEENKDYQILSVPVLKQQEGITYDLDGKSFYYTSERGNPVPIVRVKCSQK